MHEWQCSVIINKNMLVLPRADIKPVPTVQMPKVYYITYSMSKNIIPGVTMAESICSSFTIENDNGFEVRIATEKTANIILYLICFIIPVLTWAAAAAVVWC